MEYKIPENNWGLPLDSALSIAEPGDKIVVTNEVVQAFARSAAIRVEKSFVEIVVAEGDDG